VAAGTDLIVGLLAGARWANAAAETRWGAPIVVNMPTEEVFTTPDHRRTEGVVRISRPIHLVRGAGRVEGLTLRFEHGRAVRIDATHGADRARAQMAIDGGAARLGEVALVDLSGRADRDRLRRRPDRRERHQPHRLGATPSHSP